MKYIDMHTHVFPAGIAAKAVHFLEEYYHRSWAGDGSGDVRAIVKDLREYGYDGGFSMEPHVAAVFHDEAKEESDSLDKIKYESYVEYGRRFEKLLRDCGWEF